jgi:deazaflavin-dependent oxidoreductase (nitroreductase family)
MAMAAHAPVSTEPPSRRPLLGFRTVPGRLALTVFRVPLYLYRRGWSWLLGRVFLLLVHVGRTTGQPRETMAMVLSDDRTTRELVICSGWGPDTDWIRNLQAGPAREVVVGRDRFVPEHRFLTDGEAAAGAAVFRRRHPRRLRLVAAILGWGDLGSDDAVRAFVQRHPFVGLRPARHVEETS